MHENWLVWNRIILLCLPWILSACSSMTELSQPKETLAVVVPTPVGASATIECSPLPKDMTLNLVQLDYNKIRIQVTGLQPRENIKLVIERDVPDDRDILTTEPVTPVGEDGIFEFVRGSLEPLPGITPNRWLVKVVHARGVACGWVSLE